MELKIGEIEKNKFTVWNGNPNDRVDVRIKSIGDTVEIEGKGGNKYKEEIEEITRKYIAYKQSEDYIIKVIIEKLSWEFRYYYEASDLKVNYKKIGTQKYEIKMECWLVRKKDSYENKIIVDTSKFDKNVDIYTINVSEIEKEVYRGLKKDTSF